MVVGRRPEFKLATKQFVSDHFSISFRTSRHEHFGPGIEIAASRARLVEACDWLKSRSAIRARVADAADLHVRYQSTLSNRSLLVVEPESATDAVNVRISTAKRGLGTIAVENYRLSEESGNGGVRRTIIGDIAAYGSCLSVGGLTFELSGDTVSGRFVAETLGGKPTKLICAPKTTASTFKVEGATSSMCALTKPQVVEFSGIDEESDHRTRLAQNALVLSDAPGALSAGQGLSVMTGHVVCSGCVSDRKPADIRYFSTHVTRPEDLLWLGFEFYNFELKTEKGGRQYLSPLPVAGLPLVVVHFPPQHILEDAFNEDLGCTPTPPKLSFPLGAKLSGPSKLVFEIPRELDRIDLTLDAMTDWRAWTIRKVADARHPRLIRAPAWDETSVEAPSRMFTQPADGTWWRRKEFEGPAQERYVLFHAELRPSSSFDPTEPDGIRRSRFVPFWTPDFEETGVKIPDSGTTPNVFLRLGSRLIGLDPLGRKTPTSEGCAASAPATDRPPLRSDPLSESDRRQIVRLSHDSTICATPPAANYLMLTARGAFADVEGYWPQTKARSCVNISLEKWLQIITEGQDQKITIQKRGLLYPFGHRVIYVKDTNRKIHEQDGALYAVEKTTYYLVIRQRTIDYQSARLRDGDVDRSFQLPFRELTIVEPVSPNLDEPTMIPKLKQFPLCRDAFWATRCNTLWEFTLDGFDWAGNRVHFKHPALFVQDTLEPDDVAVVEAEYRTPSDANIAAYRPNRRDLAAQLVALAPSSSKGDTDVNALRIDFSGLPQALKYGPFCPPEDQEIPEEELCKILDYGETENSAPFYPIAYAVESRLPTLGKVATSGGGEMWMEIADPRSDPLEVFAVKHPDDGYGGEFRLAFHTESDRSGGIAGPTPTINAVSALKGPVGLPANGQTARAPSRGGSAATLVALGGGGLPTPSSFFSVLDAKIFGVLPISLLLTELGIDLTMPSLMSYLSSGGETSTTTGYVYEIETDKLANWPGGDFGFQFENSISDGGDGAKLAITGGAEVELSENPTVVGFISGSLTNFRLRLVFLGNGIEAPFPTVRFHAPLGQKVQFDVQVGDVKFIGPLMEFITELKQYLGLGNGFDIDVRYDSLTASVGPFALPDIGIGVFALSNISFSAICNIYFRGNRPLSFGFAFASQDQPFTLAIAFLAGRGYFAFEVDTSGIQRIEAALEFGAFAALSFGVAEGYLYVMGGVFFSTEKVPAKLPAGSNTQVYEVQISLEIYVRFGGGLTALGFISITVDVHLGLSVVKRGQQTFAEGRATCTYSVSIGFFKKSFSVTFSRSFAGSSTANSDARLGGMNSFAAALPYPPAEGATCETPSCVDAIGRQNFRTFWYGFDGALAA